MHTPSNPGRSPRRAALAALGLSVGIATVLAGCSTADNGPGEAVGDGVPVGASAEEYQAVLADMEPIELILQSANAAATHPDAAGTLAFMDRVTEYSGGKITFDVTFANGIVPVLETANALQDGRIDIVNWWPQYDSSEYPANNLMLDASVVRDPRMITGMYSIMGAMQEVALDTPEVLAEYTSKGITPLNIMSPDGPTIIACSEPITSLDDLRNKQIRSGGTVLSRQIEGLGAIPVSLPFPEIYEALQRGILDCSSGGHAVAMNNGHLEVAPYVYHTEVASLASTPTNWFIGPRFRELPLAAQQLILESAPLERAHSLDNWAERIATDAASLAQQHGGGFFAMPGDVEEALAATNEEILADVEATSLFDGGDFITRLHAINEKWIDLVQELGYTDEGAISTFPEWYAGPYGFEPWYDAVVAEIIAKHRPE